MQIAGDGKAFRSEIGFGNTAKGFDPELFENWNCNTFLVFGQKLA